MGSMHVTSQILPHFTCCCINFQLPIYIVETLKKKLPCLGTSVKIGARERVSFSLFSLLRDFPIFLSSIASMCTTQNIRGAHNVMDFDCGFPKLSLFVNPDNEPYFGVLIRQTTSVPKLSKNVQACQAKLPNWGPEGGGHGPDLKKYIFKFPSKIYSKCVSAGSS